RLRRGIGARHRRLPPRPGAGPASDGAGRQAFPCRNQRLHRAARRRHADRGGARRRPGQGDAARDGRTLKGRSATFPARCVQRTNPAPLMEFFRVTNWDQYQHYKDRDPTWIKLYARLLDDYGFATLPDNSKWHLIGIFLLASKQGNRIPGDPRWVRKKIAA